MDEDYSKNTQYAKLEFFQNFGSKIKYYQSEIEKDSYKTLDKDVYEIINKKEILIGDRLIDIKNILGSPENEISRKIEDRTYKMINYLIDNRSYKLFFKNDILIDIDFE